MDEQRIEKEVRRAVLELYDGRRLEGEVFLRLYEAHHAGSQKIGDLLNGDLSFIPVRTGGRIMLINVTRIVSVEVRQDDELDELMTLGRKYTVGVTMLDGKQRRGEIYVNLPDESSRFKDYINQPVRFFPLIESGLIVYVNRQFVLFAHD